MLERYYSIGSVSFDEWLRNTTITKEKLQKTLDERYGVGMFGVFVNQFFDFKIRKIRDTFGSLSIISNVRDLNTKLGRFSDFWTIHVDIKGVAREKSIRSFIGKADKIVERLWILKKFSDINDSKLAKFSYIIEDVRIKRVRCRGKKAWKIEFKLKERFLRGNSIFLDSQYGSFIIKMCKICKEKDGYYYFYVNDKEEMEIKKQLLS